MGESTLLTGDYNFHPHVAVHRGSERNGIVNMDYIGFSPQCKTQYKDVNSDTTNSIYYDKYKARDGGQTPDRFYKFELLGDHSISGFSREKYFKSLKKCDVKPVKPDNAFWALTLEFTRRHLSFLAGSRPSTTMDVNWEKAAGVPYDKIGRPKKRDFLKTPGYIRQEMNRKHVPIWKVPPKKEYLPTVEVLDGKMRTFFIPDFPFLLHQKFCWDEQNTRLKNNHNRCWSKYGYTKQRGGFHRLYKKLERFRLRFTIDVSGWDRVLPILQDVYDLREHFLNKKYLSEDYLNWVIRNTVHSYITTFEGDIYQRHCGNGSGSNCTSEDNTIAHIMISFYLFIKLYYRKYNEMPEYEEFIKFLEMGLYGDDSIGGADPEYFGVDSVDDFKTFVIDVYKEFGMTVKPSQFKVGIETGPMIGYEFLGSTSAYHEEIGMYNPEPRLGKVATSIRNILISQDNIQVLVSKLVAAYEIVGLSKNEDCKFVAEFIKDFGNFLLETEVMEPEESSQLYQITTGSHPIYEILYGWESAVKTDQFFVDEKLTSNPIFFTG